MKKTHTTFIKEPTMSTPVSFSPFVALSLIKETRANAVARRRRNVSRQPKPPPKPKPLPRPKISSLPHSSHVVISPDPMRTNAVSVVRRSIFGNGQDDGGVEMETGMGREIEQFGDNDSDTTVTPIPRKEDKMDTDADTNRVVSTTEPGSSADNSTPPPPPPTLQTIPIELRTKILTLYLYTSPYIFFPSYRINTALTQRMLPQTPYLLLTWPFLIHFLLPLLHTSAQLRLELCQILVFASLRTANPALYVRVWNWVDEGYARRRRDLIRNWDFEVLGSSYVQLMMQTVNGVVWVCSRRGWESVVKKKEKVFERDVERAVDMVGIM
jgi:hypothetical protein